MPKKSTPAAPSPPVPPDPVHPQDCVQAAIHILQRLAANMEAFAAIKTASEVDGEDDDFDKAPVLPQLQFLTRAQSPLAVPLERLSPAALTHVMDTIAAAYEAELRDDILAADQEIQSLKRLLLPEEPIPD